MLIDLHTSAPTTVLPDTFVDSLDPGGRPPRVVIDTAVVISALVFGGEPARRLRRAWRHGFCRPLMCRGTLLDLTEALADGRFGFTAQEQRRMLGEYLPYVLKVRVPEATAPAKADPAPLPFVQLAMAGRAHLMVSSDETLLRTGDQLPFPVLAMQPFLDVLRCLPITPRPLR
jgi:predicted nucleic acid-binding protein